MKKITLSSINAELPRIDTLIRRYRLLEWAGYFRKGTQTISAVFADYSDAGRCTGISVYAYGDAKESRHYYGIGKTVNITGIIGDWMLGEYGRAEVCRRIQAAIAEAKAEET